MSTILFIGAMQDEIRPLTTVFNTQENALGDQQAKVGENDIIVICCGVGKVNAAASTQKAIILYQPDFVVNVGIAGSLAHELPLCTTVLCKYSRYHDFHPDDILNRYPPFCAEMEAGEMLLSTAQDAVKACPSVKNSVVGKIVTGDCIVADSELCRKLAEDYGAQCVDMESAAIAHVCKLEDVEFLAVRCLSDFADEDAMDEMNRQVYKAAAQTAEIAQYLAQNL